MKTFYFVGGPIPGEREVFFQKLAEAGGPPVGWHIYPHACGDGRALHVIEATDVAPIRRHLAGFGAGYEQGPIIEVINPVDVGRSSTDGGV